MKTESRDEMTYWRRGCGPADYQDDDPGPAIYLIDRNGGSRILCIEKRKDGAVCFEEMCDQYFDVTLTQEQAIQALQEAIQWLET